MPTGMHYCSETVDFKWFATIDGKVKVILQAIRELGKENLSIHEWRSRNLYWWRARRTTETVNKCDGLYIILDNGDVRTMFHWTHVFKEMIKEYNTSIWPGLHIIHANLKPIQPLPDVANQKKKQLRIINNFNKKIRN